jgi:hypothetical protein
VNGWQFDREVDGPRQRRKQERSTRRRAPDEAASARRFVGGVVRHAAAANKDKAERAHERRNEESIDGTDSNALNTRCVASGESANKHPPHIMNDASQQKLTCSISANKSSVLLDMLSELLG